MVSGVFSTVKRYGDYGANFLLGTGADTVGKEIGTAIKNRKSVNMSLPKSIGVGFRKGYELTNKEVAASGGFFKNLAKALRETPEAVKKGWKSAEGFAKVGKAIKPLGRLLPFAVNAIWLASSIPDIVSRVKDEGLWGGIKETGKAIAKMAIFSVSAAAGGVFGFIGMLGVPMLTGIVADKILGKSYGQKKAEAEEAKQQAQIENNPFAKNQVGQKLDIVSAA